VTVRSAPAVHRLVVGVPRLLRYSLLLACGVAFFVAPSAWAVIRVDAPITQIYDIAKLVLIGKVVSIDASKKIVEVEVDKVSKGDFASHRVQIQLGNINDYFRQVELNQPVVIFNGLKSALVHLADNFLSAEPLHGSEPPILKVNKVNPIQWSFPGRTVALVRLVDEIASGHPTLLNLIEHVVWGGGINQWGRVLPNADYVVASDLNGDGKAEVLIGNRRSAQLLVNTGTRFKDETVKWGLRNARGKWAACGDINGDGRVDLLIGNRFWLNRGHHFAPGPVLPLPSDADFLTVALLDVTSGGRPDAVFLTKNGDLQIFENPGRGHTRWKAAPTRRLWADGSEATAAALSIDWGDTGKPHAIVAGVSGITRYALDPDGGPPAGLDRLIGDPLKTYDKTKELGRWDVFAVVPLDINGDGLEDLIVILDKGGPTLVNRGFGAFFLNPLPAEATRALGGKEVPWKLTAGTRFGAGDIHGDKFDDLLIVTPEGRLFELNNTPYERLPNRFQ
jgi:hypothetical protein